MVKKQQAGQARQWLPGVAWGVLFLAGCSHPTNVSQPHDPLHGILAPPSLPRPTNSPNAGPTATPAVTQTNDASAVPTSSNPATLAAMSWTGPAGRTLAIDDSGPPFLPGQLTSGSRSQRPLGPNPNPKVEQVPDVNPTPTAQPQSQGPPSSGFQPAAQPAPAAPVSADDSVSKQLQDRGVVNQKQDVVPDGIRLTCYLSRGLSGGLRILEVTATDYATAAKAILQQLDNSR